MMKDMEWKGNRRERSNRRRRRKPLLPKGFGGLCISKGRRCTYNLSLEGKGQLL